MRGRFWLILIWLARQAVHGLWLYIIKLYIRRNFRLVRLFSLSVFGRRSPLRSIFIISCPFHIGRTHGCDIRHESSFDPTPKHRAATICTDDWMGERGREKYILVSFWLASGRKRDVCADKTQRRLEIRVYDISRVWLAQNEAWNIEGWTLLNEGWKEISKVHAPFKAGKLAEKKTFTWEWNAI